MSLAPYVRILARGQGRARGFTQDEAAEAMTLMLTPDVSREAVGAILMLLRMKGETAAEIAGFSSAARASLPCWTGPRAALDWPSYAAGRTRGLPWFLLSARLVADAGIPVLLHGWNAHQGAGADLRAALPTVGVRSADSVQVAGDLLTRDRIAYLPLESLSPPLMALLCLRDALGLRSCINTVCRMLNPGGAETAVQGVFHPPYRELQADAGQMLGLRQLTVLKGGGGEFEHHPAKNIETFGLRNGQRWTGLTGKQLADHRRLSEGPRDPSLLAQIWRGERHDPFAEAIVVSTAALALDTAGVADPESKARDSAA
ncbi:glycosyl transferase family protein [Profundibacterium mesophilum]|uniref:Anthranilate phosphoribosyltransferase n=1 Tax=Profundibacterium mesophilum KAUST100406-0324 TaxID=1037889 RepID=A0A921NUG1_9RHOB|nr:glycosyl transferase family protein [Profundibacterium mesophilum]KAF0676864.1 anthranilate phosphoribosyltransferase [Profundibacterium mesophilum KAUST100406-0324]